MCIAVICALQKESSCIIIPTLFYNSGLKDDICRQSICIAVVLSLQTDLVI